MIIQLLGVALISLLTITPTIQQNNIEQIKIQNIIFEQNLPNTNYPQQVLNIKTWANYTSGSGGTFNSAWYQNNQRFYDWSNTEATLSISNLTTTTITNDNLFLYQTNTNYSGNVIKALLRHHYFVTRGGNPTSESFSFTATDNDLLRTTTYYTYTLNGAQGQVNGRIYVREQSNVLSDVTLSVSNNNVSLPQNSSIVQIINEIQPNSSFNNTTDNGILYYFFNQSIPINNIGSYTRQLYARDYYGVTRNFGQVVINITEPDTTPPVITGPSSVTFEVGTYSLIEQILNDLYTFTDNVGIEDAYYFPVTSINTVGTFNITVYATDAAGNQTNLPVTITTTPPPPTDTTPPVIVGSDTITRQLGQVNNDAQLANVFNITDDFTQPSAIVKTISGTRSYTEAGTYNLTLTATDIAGNVATKQFTFIINPPIIDNEPPLIVSDLIVSITIGDFTDRQEILDFYTTVTDNVALSTVLLVGDINFNVIGDYQLQIIATDTSQNQATRNILVRIREEVVLGNYNPLTDLLSGIFGGALSMIFTIGTINVLGLRLLDAMGVIILGAVLLFVYKAIKGGS
jgi:hypothetical protein